MAYSNNYGNYNNNNNNNNESNITAEDKGKLALAKEYIKGEEQVERVKISKEMIERSFLQVGIFGPDVGGMLKDWLKAQKGMPTITKEGIVAKKGGKEVQYKYASLDAVLSSIKPILSENNLIITQNAYADSVDVGVQTILLHTSGSEYRTTPLMWSYFKTLQFNENEIQNIGAILTYLKKASIYALLGLEFEDENNSEKNFSTNKYNNYNNYNNYSGYSNNKSNYGNVGYMSQQPQVDYSKPPYGDFNKPTPYEPAPEMQQQTPQQPVKQQPQPKSQGNQPINQQPQPQPQSQQQVNPNAITDKTKALVNEKIKELGWTMEQVKQTIKVSRELEEYSEADARKLYEILNKLLAKKKAKQAAATN